MIIIGLGANLDGDYGSPEECLKSCPDLLSAKGINVLKFSNIWKSAPVPVSDQPWYRNAVCSVETDLRPHDLLGALAEIEGEAGRTRHTQNEARVIDLDLLAYNNEVIEDNILSLPHPRMQSRAFVLYPLREVAPYWIHPILGKSVDDLVGKIPEGQEIELCQQIL